MGFRAHSIGPCTLIHGDCREVMPEIGAELLSGPVALITDPVWPNCPPGALPGSDDPMALWREAWGAMPSLARAVVVMRGDSDPRFLDAVPASMPFFRTVHMPYAVPSHRGRLLGGDEIAYAFGAPIRSARGRRMIPGRAQAAQPRRRRPIHPCERALAHMRFLVHWWSDPGDLVLDPFMGGATIGEAVVREGGRAYLGIEIDPGFFAAAVRRIEAAVAEQAGAMNFGLAGPPAVHQD